MTWTFLLKYRKDIGYALVILALIVGFLVYRHSLIVKGEDRILAQDKVAVEKRNTEIAAQKAKDERVLKDAEDAHKKEIQLIKDVSSRPLPPIRLCNAASSSALSAASGLSESGGSGAGNVSEMQGRDSGVREEQGPDISRLFDALARRADRLSADARELNTVTHPQ